MAAFTGLYPWQYRIHKEPLVVVAEGKMAMSSMCGTVSRSNPYKRWAEMSIPITSRTRSASLKRRGSTRVAARILREGVYAIINLGLFVVITEDRVFSGPVREAIRSRVHRGRHNRLYARLIRNTGTVRAVRAVSALQIADLSASEAVAAAQAKKRPSSIRMSIPF